MKDINSFGEFLKKYRNERGLSTNDLYQMTGVSQPYLSQIENGKKPSTKIIKKISDGLNLNYYYLMRIAGYTTDEDIENLYKQLNIKEKTVISNTNKYRKIFDEVQHLNELITLNKEDTSSELLETLKKREEELLLLEQTIEKDKSDTIEIFKKLDSSLNGIEKQQLEKLMNDFWNIQITEVDLLELLDSNAEITFGHKKLSDSDKEKIKSFLKVLFS